jgi:hypothetical protein
MTSPGRAFEFWRERNKIRGGFIGGNGVVVAKRRHVTIGADDRICRSQPNDNPSAHIPRAESMPLFAQGCKHLRRQD